MHQNDAQKSSRQGGDQKFQALRRWTPPPLSLIKKFPISLKVKAKVKGDPMALTEKMKKFARAIVDGATNKEAAISAGYEEKTASQQGSKLRNNSEIIVYIEKLKAEKEGRTLTSEKPKVKTENSGEYDNPLNDDDYAKDDPLQFLIDVMNKSDDMFLRFNAAKAALPYVHGKVAEKGKKETKAETAREGSKSGKFATLDNQLMS